MVKTMEELCMLSAEHVTWLVDDYLIPQMRIDSVGRGRDFVNLMESDPELVKRMIARGLADEYGIAIIINFKEPVIINHDKDSESIFKMLLSRAAVIATI